MSMDMDFDLGPLTWVKGELDNALEAARVALAGWNGEDITPLKTAAAHLHQVRGALEIVDLRGVTQVTGETERLLAEMETRAELRDRDSAEIILRAIAALKTYLDGLMAGTPPMELKLAGHLHALVTRRGGEAPAPSELFHPDTDIRVPRPAPEPQLTEAVRAASVHAARQRYQLGLLKVLRNDDAAAGLDQMARAVGEIERIAPGTAQYTFWWSVGALMDALERRAQPADFWIKRLCGRVDLQMRRLMEGSRQLADRLFRDVLYHLGRDEAADGRAAQARELFRLRSHFPDRADDALTAEHLAQLAALRESLATAKDHWMRYCGGARESLEAFKHGVAGFFEASSRLPNPAMQSLARMVQAVTKRLSGDDATAQNEALQLEMATALLLAQNAAEHYEKLDDQFGRQCEALTMRLQAAIDPHFDTSTIPEVELLDEVSRAAQEKLVVSQVAQEIQVNLNQIEEILDKFFRNAQERGGLPMVPSLMKQIQGALNILELDTAVSLVDEALRRIQHFAEPDAQIAPENLNWVAEALSTLGLYMDSLRYGRDDKQSMIRLLAEPEVDMPRETSVESEIHAETERLKESVSRWAAEGGDAEGREALRGELGKLARDADLIGDADLRGQADAALKALSAADAPEAVREAVVNLGGAPTAAPAPSADSMRLAAATDDTIDRELLDTYIEEANEVLGVIASKVARLHVSPYDTDAFTTIRRGFHTLKGSGRMVGLTDLAELAWEVEQTLNLWLRDERAPDAAMLRFLEDTGNAFEVWVNELDEQGRARVEADHLARAARVLRGEQVAPVEAPPPKPEADDTAAPAAAVGDADAGTGAPTETDVAMERDGGQDDAEDHLVDIGGHKLPAELFDIFSNEAGNRLDELAVAVSEMTGGDRPDGWEAFARAAHTLAGISRTTGFTPLAEAAHALELWAGAWPDRRAPLDEDAAAVLDRCLNTLARAVEGILARRYPTPMPEIEAGLADLAAPLPAGSDDKAAEPVDIDASSDQAPVAARAGDEHGETPRPPAIDFADDLPPELAEELARVLADGPDESSLTHFVPPQPAAPARPREEPAPVRDEIDEQLLPIFLEEAAELLPRIGEILRAWRAEPDAAEPRDAFKRALHTLKGSARMAGAMILGDTVHKLETRVIELGEGAADADFLDDMETAYDHFAELVEHLHGGPMPDEAVAPASPAAAPTVPAGAMPAPVAQPARAPDEDMRARQAMRLKADILDTLLNEAGEVAIARARIENVLGNHKQIVQELAANVDRLRAQLRELEIQAESQMRSRLSQMDESQFDPLEFDRFSRLQELTRMLAESVNDVSTVQDNLFAGLNEADNALIQQSRMARTLQQELMHLRMVPLNTLAERLHRVVRQSAKHTGRKAQLEIDGGQTELDRGVLDKIAAPLEHLVRNAIAHGIENPATRATAGKPEYGEVRLGARQESNEIILTLSDDGGGIDVDAVRARAEKMGWIEPGEKISDEQVEQTLFRSGFSTAEQVTELAGRGVGLDVVKNEIAGIGGRVRIDSESGRGTRFTIRLPLTLALTQVVLARAGGQTWALPANLVAQVREVKAERMHALHEAGQVELDGEAYPLRTLAELVDRTAEPSEGHYRTVLLLRAGDRRLAIRIDALEGNFEAVVKNIGPQLARIVGVSGATVLGDGRVALILDPFQLAERAPRLTIEEEERTTEQAPLVMVVDDSLTVRKITSRFLEREGFRVITARDGVEALEILETEKPIAMLLDIEMPRMDGFEVARNLRAGTTHRDLPIIMITSRTAEKHRKHALELGVDAYLGKPYQEEELLTTLHRLSAARMAEIDA